MPSSSNAVFIENGTFVDYFGNPIDISAIGLVGPTGPAGQNGSIGPTGPSDTSVTTTSAKKVVKEFSAIGDGEILTITRADLETAIGGSATTDYFIAGGVGTTSPENSTVSFADMNIQFWLLIAGTWYQYNTGGSPIGVSGSTGIIDTTIDETTGDISILLNIAPFPFQCRVRVIIII